MNNWQKVINVCFAVIVTLLIFQNQQLKNQVDMSEGSAQLDVVKTLDRLNSIEDDLGRIAKTLVIETEPNRLDDLEELVLSIAPELLKTQKWDDKQDRDLSELNRNVKDLKANNRNFNRNVLKIVGDKCDVSGFGNYWDFSCKRK
tara:strand:- start:221 stop:655 length:435 start_codon:yes stop_codon:yes gene_type:complete